ncbi:helix-turn-helix domain-containing protein [Polaribacter sp. Z014]|uniref:helix-turn-helix domain-containing protein n=1 Tax=Polaribacter sp. Z014 TaxID=2927126 RepID=UPI002020DFAD|nr:helix-turn-helix transcriptional regulator [Polaribacter sp. Z014]MCL7763253.1 helix-turn-helix domain-containing protein [Polaribacter sp. Z014]
MVNKFLLKEFGLRIRDLRTQENLSQEQLSFRTGFHRTYIGMIERGERNISLTNIAVFSKAFEMDISELLNFKNQNSKLSYHDYKLKTDSDE